jgi:hypothetical protein
LKSKKTARADALRQYTAGCEYEEGVDASGTFSRRRAMQENRISPDVTHRKHTQVGPSLTEAKAPLPQVGKVKE